MPGIGLSARRRAHALVILTLLLLSARAAAAQPAGFVYAVQQVPFGANQLHGFRLDATTGALTPIPGLPIATGGNGSGSLTTELVAYGNGRLYVVNDGSDTLSVFAVNRTTGALTAMPYSPVALGVGQWVCAAVHPSGSPVVVGEGLSGALASFNVTATAAIAATGSSFGTGAARPYSCAFSRDGAYVYTGGNTGSFIAGFSVAAASGILTALAGSPFDAGANSPTGLALDTSGRLFTIIADAPNQVRAFTTSGGVLSGVTNNPFSSELQIGVHGVVHPAGFYMAVDRLGNSVGVYRVSGSGAATTLTAVDDSPFASGGFLTDVLALTQDASLLVAANGASASLTVFHVNATTGALTLLGTQPDGTLGASGFTAGLVSVPLAVGPFDRDGDLKADLGVFRPSDGTWWILQSASGFTTFAAHTFGVSTDVPVPADYDGDRQMDVAVFRPSDGAWYIVLSSTNYAALMGVTWGASTDIPVPADYDGDGRADIAIFRPSTGVWWILKSSTNFTSYVTYLWGATTDRPMPGDYDGDAKTDVAIFRPSTGEWWILFSSADYTTFTAFPWGAVGDVTVPGDYDGDGKTDVAIFRPSTGVWYVLKSSTAFTSYVSYVWGSSTDLAVPADYDGDGRTDVAIFRPSTREWWVLLSSANYTTFMTFVWGASTDVPLAKR